MFRAQFDLRRYGKRVVRCTAAVVGALCGLPRSQYTNSITAEDLRGSRQARVLPLIVC